MSEEDCLQVCQGEELHDYRERRRSRRNELTATRSACDRDGRQALISQRHREMTDCRVEVVVLQGYSFVH